MLPQTLLDRMKEIKSVLEAKSPEEVEGATFFRVAEIHNGSRIYQSQLTQKVLPVMQYTPSVKGKKPQKPKPFYNTSLKLYTEYAVKGLSPDFGLRELRNTSGYKKWMINLVNGYTVSQIDECSDLIDLSYKITPVLFLQSKQHSRFIRSTFIDQSTKSYVIAFTSTKDDCLFIVAMNQVFDKTYIRFYLHSEAKHSSSVMGYIPSNAMRENAFMFARSMACFKTYVKHAFLIAESQLQFQPYVEEPEKKLKPAVKRMKEVKQQVQNEQLAFTANSLNMHSGINFVEPTPLIHSRPN
ncbi:hypothetical protein FGO68_gene6764 [Halteria grandinella]|uniref:Uncharacterized protein n=1 Tax=Halteria grandinella TaxID=5974 RepID=A0A8J8T5R6_HALGN|nr:hypothetical protein FGO68_gene6764 [Halteria grandinella]